MLIVVFTEEVIIIFLCFAGNVSLAATEAKCAIDQDYVSTYTNEPKDPSCIYLFIS